MTINAERESAIQEVSPTSLNMLHFRTPALDGSRIIKFRKTLNDSSNLESQLPQIDMSMQKLLAETEKRFRRINEAKGEFRKEEDMLKSSINIAGIYLRMREAFPQMPFDKFISGFRTSLDMLFRIFKTAENSSPILMQKAGSNISNDISHIIIETAKNIPQSFNQNPEEWKKFISISYNLPELKILKKNNNKTANKIDLDIEYVNPLGIPDWFSDDIKDEPDKSVIQEEMQEDENLFEKVSDHFKETDKQQKIIGEFTIKKIGKPFNWMSLRIEQIFSDTRSIAAPIFLMHLIENSPDRIIEASRKNNKAELTEEALKGYIESDEIMETPEAFALFLEKQLKDAEIIKSVNNPIDASFVNFVNQSLLNREEPQDETSKKTANIMRYRIKPLLHTLDENDINYIKEIVKEYVGHSIEYFIWELADLLAYKFKYHTTANNDDRLVKGSINEIRKFSGTFLRKNWKWIYENLKLELQQIDQGKTILSNEQSSIDEPENRVDIQIEIEDSAKEIAAGNLEGWHLLYSKNKTTDSNHLVEIDGETIEQRTITLEDLLKREGIPNSIKSTSIIDAFDWLVTVPKEVEQIRIRKTVNGQVFKKLKRGHMRIFYVMDETKRQIIFFLHQKQAWKYGF